MKGERVAWGSFCAKREREWGGVQERRDAIALLTRESALAWLPQPHPSVLLQRVFSNFEIVAVSRPYRWVLFFVLFFLLPQANGRSMCRFWVHPSNWRVVLNSTHLLVGFLFKIWMLSNWFNHANISFLVFWVVTCFFVSQGFISIYEGR
jgi:hypothetical protein